MGGLVFSALHLALVDPTQFATPEENCNGRLRWNCFLGANSNQYSLNSMC